MVQGSLKGSKTKLNVRLFGIIKLHLILFVFTFNSIINKNIVYIIHDETKTKRNMIIQIRIHSMTLH